MRKFLILPLALLAGLIAAGPASANLASVSTTLDGNGFPSFYTDQSGQQVSLCAADPNCGGADLAADGEAFFWNGQTTLAIGGDELTVTYALEGAFDPDTGEPTTFQRVRVSSKSPAKLETGDYVISGPYGTVTAAAHGTKNLLTVDTPSAPVPGAFSGALVGPLTTVLTSVSAPAGFYGDGVTEDETTSHAAAAVTITHGTESETTTKWVITGSSPSAVPVVLPDADGDGVQDAFDTCPTVAGPAINNGCPITAPVVSVSTVAAAPTIVTTTTAAPAAVTTPTVSATPVPTVPTRKSAPKLEGRVLSVNRARKTFRLRLEKGTIVTIKVSAKTSYQRLRNFRSIRRGLHLEVRVKAGNIATRIEH